MKVKLLLAAGLLIITGCSHQTKLSVVKQELIGVWHEESPISSQIGELILRDNGTFSVAQKSYAVVKDYIGTYTIEPKKRLLHLKITGGKNVPKNARVDNFHYTFKNDNKLILSGGYFGRLNNNTFMKDRYTFVKGYQAPKSIKK